MERFIKRKNRASNKQYRDGWDRIFTKKTEPEAPRCPACQAELTLDECMADECYECGEDLSKYAEIM